MRTFKNAGKKLIGLLAVGAIVTTAVINGSSPKAHANVETNGDVKQNMENGAYSYCVEGAGTGTEFNADNWTFKSLMDNGVSDKYLDKKSLENGIKCLDKKFATGIVANIHSQAKEPVIRLINGMEYENMKDVGTDSRSGYAMLDKKINLDDKSRFSAKFTFSMPEATCYDGYKKGAGGDGIVFVITTDEELNGLSGGAIGYKGIKNSVGIELDSFYNTDNGQKYFDPTYDKKYESYRKDHVAVVLNGKNTSVDDHIATSFLYESGHLEGFTQQGSLTTYGEECDTRLFTVWAEYDGNNLYVSYAKGDFVNAVRPETAQIVVDSSKEPAVKAQLDNFAGDFVKIGFTSAIGSSKANHTIHSVAFANEYIEGGIKTAYTENYYVEVPADAVAENAIEVNGKKYILVKTNVVLDAEAGSNVAITDLTEEYIDDYAAADYAEMGYPSVAEVSVDGTTVVNQFFSKISIEITAEDEYYTGNPYSSDEVKVLLGEEDDVVVYYEGTGDTKYEKTTTPPIEVGTYVATAVLGNAKATDEFEILPVDKNEDETDDSSEESTDGSSEGSTEGTTEEKGTEEIIEEEEDIELDIPEAAPSVDVEEETTEKTTEETVVLDAEEEEEDIEIGIPQAAPGVDANAKTGDSSNLTIIFVVMLISGLGVLVASKKRKTA